MKGKTMLSVSEVAERLGTAKRSVQLWAQNGRFKGAKRIEIPGGHYWLIPEASLTGFEVRSPGRPHKPVGELVGPVRRKDRGTGKRK